MDGVYEYLVRENVMRTSDCVSRVTEYKAIPKLHCIYLLRSNLAKSKVLM